MRPEAQVDSTLADYGITPPSGYGRGGVAHQWWVNTIAEWLQEQGFSPVVEDESSGARVDLSFAVRRKKIAVEVEMAEGHALENIRKDLEAGFQKALASESGDLPSNVRIGQLQDYAELHTPPLIPHPPPLRRPNQDKEPRRRRRRAAAPPAGRSPLMEPGTLTTPMAADYVGLSPATLETFRVRGGGPVFVKLGARVVYQREDLAHFASGDSAYDNLVCVLKDGVIRAGTMPWTNRPAVCLTECPWASLIDHARRYSPYGIGFGKHHVFAAGGGPAYYVRADHFHKQQWDPDIHTFVTPFWPAYRPPSLRTPTLLGGKTIDYSHEREWRVPHDFSFDLERIAFVILDTYKDMARFPKELKDRVGREKFILMDIYRKIEELWPTHIMPRT